MGLTNGQNIRAARCQETAEGTPNAAYPPTIATFIPLRSKLRASTRRQTKFLSRLVNITVLLSLPPQQGGFRQSRQPDGDLRLGEAACCNDLKRKNHSHVELTN